MKSKSGFRSNPGSSHSRVKDGQEPVPPEIGVTPEDYGTHLDVDFSVLGDRRSQRHDPHTSARQGDEPHLIGGDDELDPVPGAQFGEQP